MSTPNSTETLDLIADDLDVVRTYDDAQRALWASSAVALWADDRTPGDGRLRSLIEAAEDLRVALQVRDHHGYGTTAIAALLAPEPKVAIELAARLANRRGAQSVIIEFSPNVSEPTLAVESVGDSGHALLIDLDDKGVAINLVFAGSNLLSDLDDGELSVTELEHADVADLVRTAVASSLPWTDHTRPNQLVAAARVSALLGIGLEALRLDLTPVDLVPYVERQPEPAEDRYALDLLRSTCGHILAEPPPDAWVGVQDVFGIDRPDADDVRAASGVAQPESASDLARMSAAYVRPRELNDFDPADCDAIDALEWADWLGAIVQLVRRGPGTLVTPELLVDNVNASPEVTTTIPKKDRDYIAYGFGLTLHAWELTGALDQDGCLTELGRWLLPVGLSLVAGAPTSEFS